MERNVTKFNSFFSNSFFSYKNENIFSKKKNLHFNASFLRTDGGRILTKTQSKDRKKEIVEKETKKKLWTRCLFALFQYYKSPLPQYLLPMRKRAQSSNTQPLSSAHSRNPPGGPPSLLDGVLSFFFTHCDADRDKEQINSNITIVYFVEAK